MIQICFPSLPPRSHHSRVSRSVLYLFIFNFYYDIVHVVQILYFRITENFNINLDLLLFTETDGGGQLNISMRHIATSFDLILTIFITSLKFPIICFIHLHFQKNKRSSRRLCVTNSGKSVPQVVL